MAGYKTWAVGEEVLAVDLNSYIQSQAVARFASASTRTAQLPAPVLNQLSSLDTSPGTIEFWNGSGWARLSSDGAVQNYTPAWLPGTNLGGGGSVTGRYQFVSPFLMFLRVGLALGTSPTLSTGVFGIGLPAGYTAAGSAMWGAGTLSFFGRGAFQMLPYVDPAGDASRVFFSAPRGVAPGITDGSTAVIMDNVTNTGPGAWTVAGSSLRASLLVEVGQRW
jgi:hypothetical protein